MRIRNILIGLFILSVGGLIYVQYQYLRVGLNLAALQFNGKMGEVITEVKDGLSYENELSVLVGAAITEDTQKFKLSLDSVQDASRYFLNDFLKEVLVGHGINSEYSYVLKNRKSKVFLLAPGFTESAGDRLSFPLQLRGYLPEHTGEDLILELQFPNLNAYFLSQLRGLTIPGLFFLLSMIAITLWVTRGFLRQRSLITVTNEFINNLTHELKTPVFSIGLATKLLAEGKATDQKEVAKIIHTQLDKLKGHIDRVLELARLEERGEVLRKSKFEVRELLEEVAEEFSGVAYLENIDFELHAKEDRQEITGIRAHLKNAIDTLLDNAKKYSEAPKTIRLEYDIKNGFAEIRVRDNGLGIALNEQKKIFEKFYRVSSGDLHPVQGFGLGLHYVKHIVRLHGGRLKLESAPGEGSVFTIQLPLK